MYELTILRLKIHETDQNNPPNERNININLYEIDNKITQKIKGNTQFILNLTQPQRERTPSRINNFNNLIPYNNQELIIEEVIKPNETE
jgi:hypothetical protein